jgi:SAM-dependent methyltransferase
MKYQPVMEIPADFEVQAERPGFYELWGHTMLAGQIARVFQEAAAAGVFEVLADGPKTKEEVASRCGLAAYAVNHVMEALSTTRYVSRDAGRFGLTELGRRWMLGLRSGGFADFVAGARVDMAPDLQAFVKSDRPEPIVSTMTTERWDLYVRAQAAYSKEREVALLEHVTVSPGALRLLDIGEGHGRRAAAFCRRYASLHATVLDLPDAVTAASPLLTSLAMPERIVTISADVRTHDLGEDTFDVILVSSGLLRPTAHETADLVGRCAKALRSGGVVAFDDFMPPRDVVAAGQQAALANLFRTMTGAEGPFTADEIADWQRAAALEALPAVAIVGNLSTLQMARKPSSAGATR